MYPSRILQNNKIRNYVFSILSRLIHMFWLPLNESIEGKGYFMVHDNHLNTKKMN